MASYLSRLLGLRPKRSQPPTVPTDEIAPLHLFDDTATLRGLTMMWTFKFEEVLDADKLGDSLSQLFQMDEWRKLGGRMRLRRDGKAEIHIPRPFTKERPPLYFTKEAFNMRMSEHPEASRLPRASDKPTTFPSARSFAPLAFGPGAPTCIDDYFYSDLPMFALHVVSFTDGTLVSINFNHIIGDLAGLVAIINAWQLVLAGRPEAVPPFKGFHEDTMVGICKDQATEKYVLADKQLTGWRLAAFGLRLLFDTWWNSPFDSRLFCIPKKTIDAFIQGIRDQVPQPVDGDKAASSSVFISENDIVVGWATQALSHHLSRNRPITVLQAVDPRERFKSVFQPDAAYICNAPTAVFVHYNSKEGLDKSIGELALKGRKAVLSQLTEEQMKAEAALVHKSMISTGSPPVFGESNMSFMVVSNWSKAAFQDKMDFSPAIVKNAEAGHPLGKPGRPVYYHSLSLATSLFNPNVVIIMGRDLDGNLWLSGDFPSDMWPPFLEQLERYT
ncbi:hypothetical protein TARUN_1056 [Trichoderma arundinaceum]|uniref:Lysr family regulatory n=1 Tax=Trichoderma arundinaceum TaxID=490622 RepID=A0A395NZC7_TRIAR|nr:hypothetical protein TARUN_1056 [Trichoderma arundinaceum]